MALSAFTDKSRAPREEELSVTLGKAFPLWTELKRGAGSGSIPLAAEWGYTSKTTGWGLRLKKGDRIILYMTPCEGYFLASFALGEKAAMAAAEEGLPDSVLSVIHAAKKYAEGRAVRLEVRSAKDLRIVHMLVDLKMAH